MAFEFVGLLPPPFQTPKCADWMSCWFLRVVVLFYSPPKWRLPLSSTKYRIKADIKPARNQDFVLLNTEVVLLPPLVTPWRLISTWLFCLWLWENWWVSKVCIPDRFFSYLHELCKLHGINLLHVPKWLQKIPLVVHFRTGQILARQGSFPQKKLFTHKAKILFKCNHDVRLHSKRKQWHCSTT